MRYWNQCVIIVRNKVRNTSWLWTN